MSFADRRKTLSKAITELIFHEKSQRISPGSILMLSAGIVGLHLLQQGIFGISAAGSLIANLLQFFGCAGRTCSFAAIGRSSGFTRSFWLLIGLSFVAWTVADLGWVYYESYLQISPMAKDNGIPLSNRRL